MTATLETIAQSALSSIETVRASYDIANLAIRHGIPGDFVECGVFAGSQVAAMAKALMDNPYYRQLCPGDRRIHLFDSFTGIPAGGPNDIEWLRAGHPPGHSACSIAQVRANMWLWGINESLLVYHKGLFSSTIPDATVYCLNCEAPAVKNGCPFCERILRQARIDSIAVLRLDGDLYESTKVCIKHLYPLVSAGGWIIVDDWDLSGARKAVTEGVGQFGPVYFQRQPYNIK